MNILIPIAVAAVVLGIALRLYPRWIARVFSEDDANPVPSEKFADGRDFVKSQSHVVFGHHFATIAGAGPIVGPILALAFGWQPVWLWVVLGGICFGAVHDMTVMFMSVRESGRSVRGSRRTCSGRSVRAQPDCADFRHHDRERDLPQSLRHGADVGLPDGSARARAGAAACSERWSKTVSSWDASAASLRRRCL
jgi:carbon starvation protein